MWVLTTRIVPIASGIAAQQSNNHAVIEPNAHNSGALTNAPATIAVYSTRVRSRPSRTASVRLSARRSVSRSRTLFTTRIALASSPTGTAHANACHGSACTCTKYEPATATTPKNRNTNTSPSPS